MDPIQIGLVENAISNYLLNGNTSKFVGAVKPIGLTDYTGANIFGDAGIDKLLTEAMQKIENGESYDEACRDLMDYVKSASNPVAFNASAIEGMMNEVKGVSKKLDDLAKTINNSELGANKDESKLETFPPKLPKGGYVDKITWQQVIEGALDPDRGLITSKNDVIKKGYEDGKSMKPYDKSYKAKDIDNPFTGTPWEYLNGYIKGHPNHYVSPDEYGLKFKEDISFSEVNNMNMSNDKFMKFKNLRKGSTFRAPDYPGHPKKFTYKVIDVVDGPRGLRVKAIDESRNKTATFTISDAEWFEFSEVNNMNMSNDEKLKKAVKGKVGGTYKWSKDGTVLAITDVTEDEFNEWKSLVKEVLGDSVTVIGAKTEKDLPSNIEFSDESTSIKLGEDSNKYYSTEEASKPEDTTTKEGEEMNASKSCAEEFDEAKVLEAINKLVEIAEHQGKLIEELSQRLNKSKEMSEDPSKSAEAAANDAKVAASESQVDQPEGSTDEVKVEEVKTENHSFSATNEFDRYANLKKIWS